ncbi:hypothetical protein BN9982_400020 [Mycobacterium tuberculosis]|nr:hypothetical protein BN9982_400020 [Mycobacterium tuberculosis]
MDFATQIDAAVNFNNRLPSFHASESARAEPSGSRVTPSTGALAARHRRARYPVPMRRGGWA